MVQLIAYNMCVSIIKFDNISFINKLNTCTYADLYKYNPKYRSHSWVWYLPCSLLVNNFVNILCACMTLVVIVGSCSVVL